MGPVGMIGTSGLNTGEELVNQGTDANTAIGSSVLSAAGTAAVVSIPNIGTSWKSTAGLVAAQPIAGAATTAIEQEWLKSQGYIDAAKRFDPLDPTARLTDLGMGIIFSSLGYYAGTHPAPSANKDGAGIMLDAEKLARSKPPEASFAEHRDNVERIVSDLDRGIAPQVREMVRPIVPEVETARAEILAEDHPSVDTLSERWDALPQDQKISDLYRDSVSGTLNERGFSMVEPGEFVARVSVPGIKKVNDVYGHDAGNDLYHEVGQALLSAEPNVGRDGGDYVFYVRDQAHLDEIMAKANNAMGPVKLGKKYHTGFELSGTLAKTIKESDIAHKEWKDQQRAEGKMAGRDEMPLNVTPIKGKASKRSETLSAPIPEAASKFVTESPDQAFRALHFEEKTGLLTRYGFYARPEKAYTLSMDLSGLKIADTIDPALADNINLAFGHLIAKMKGSEFDAAHLSGDEYSAKHDDRAALEQFAEALRAKGLEINIRWKDKSGNPIIKKGLVFNHGTGTDYRNADADAATRKTARNEQDLFNSGDARPTGVYTDLAGRGDVRGDIPGRREASIADKNIAADPLARQVDTILDEQGDFFMATGMIDGEGNPDMVSAREYIEQAKADLARAEAMGEIYDEAANCLRLG
jgi:GGDEF domain-containing protein